MNKYIFSFLYFITFNFYGQCNGSYDLCNKRYNEVAYLTTHNAFNSKQDRYLFPNQKTNITEQLNNGVRGLMIDVYEDNESIVVYHAYKFLGSQPLSVYLNDIKYFLDNNPNEILTIILETYTSSNAIENEISKVGLLEYLHTQDVNSLWPKLQMMIDSNKRLVILSDKNDANENQSWYHYMWDFAVENKYGQINCEFNRGNHENSLFIFNHFITSLTGNKDNANKVNSFKYFMNHITKCKDLKNKFPNFITVDFYEIGESLDVVSKLNTIEFTRNLN
ncbi:phosphatidylinositol-specific phospholipase C domain-containing protein [Flavobacteriaceae bacterium]|nr:phosphatidylinositol-specific phospholipase C domain-containing protein [Flavobacteriaceae bacterium]